MANAVQNSPDYGKINIWVESADRSYIRLNISNSGAHICMDDMDKLFEAFYREDASRNISGGRSGLGLTIVKKALDLMGVRFSLENAADGVVFRMDLPIDKNK